MECPHDAFCSNSAEVNCASWINRSASSHKSRAPSASENSSPAGCWWSERYVTVVPACDTRKPAGDEFSLADGARDLCEEADLLIHDAQFTAAEFEQKASWGHSTYGYAQWVAETCRVKRLALFHHDPSRTDASLDMIAKDVAAAASVDVFAAREGETVDVVTCSA